MNHRLNLIVTLDFSCPSLSRRTDIEEDECEKV